MVRIDDELALGRHVANELHGGGVLFICEPNHKPQRVHQRHQLRVALHDARHFHVASCADRVVMVLVSAQDGVHHRRFPLGGGKDETGYVACRHSLQRYGGSERPSILAGAVDVDVDDARKDRFGRVDLIVLRYDDATAKRRLVGFVPAVGHATRTDAAPVVSGL
ncbi:hypothetical protein D3C71_1122220 [compost metagenome]